MVGRKMNAYELAEHLEKANYMGAITSADMLRQQANRIAELEKENKFFKEDNEAMQKQIADLVVNRLEDRV